MRACGLELHPDKTQIVYCKDADDGVTMSTSGLTSSIYVSSAVVEESLGEDVCELQPAMSDQAAKAIRAEIRSWHIGKRSDKTLNDLAHMFNAKVRGWINYYGAFYRSMLYPTLRQLEHDLVLWAKRKYKRLRRHHIRAIHWLGRIARREPHLFEHWKWGLRSPVA